jgi:hypothetical protein
VGIEVLAPIEKTVREDSRQLEALGECCKLKVSKQIFSDGEVNRFALR